MDREDRNTNLAEGLTLEWSILLEHFRTNKH